MTGVAGSQSAPWVLVASQKNVAADVDEETRKRVLNEWHEDLQTETSEWLLKKGRIEPENELARVEDDLRIMAEDKVKNEERTGGWTDKNEERTKYLTKFSNRLYVCFLCRACKWYVWQERSLGYIAQHGTTSLLQLRGQVTGGRKHQRASLKSVLN